MREQLYATLRAAAVAGEPLGAIAKNGAVFAFTEKQLVYGSPQSATAVQLADITRIHSDDAGRLHIEAGEQTPISAPLQGFKTEEVRRFFQDVRDATARAKQLPQPRPLGGSPWKGGWRSPGEAEADAAAGERPGAGERQVVSVVSPVPEPEAALTSPVPPPAVTPRGPTLPPSAPVSASAPAAPAAETAVGKPPASAAASSGVMATEVGDPSDPSPASAALARLGLLGGRLRLLGGLLLLLALGLGWLQFSGGAELSAIWTVAVGGIGALALFALADMASVVAAIGRGDLPQNPAAAQGPGQG